MISRFRLFAAVTLVMIFGPVGSWTLAQSELDFVSGMEDFREVRSILPEYVHRLAGDLLKEREEAVKSWTTASDIRKRKAYVRETMVAAIGGFPERTPLNPRKVGEINRDGYKIEKIIFESQPGFYVTANLYIPTRGEGPYPAVLYPLGHERGGKSNPTWQQMLGSLAIKGYAALTWDPLGQGERVQMYDPDFGDSKVFRSTTEHTLTGIQCLLVGDNLARYMIWDGVRALDYLISRPEVDSGRIACSGNSGGGTHTAYLSALDDRIQVAAPSCYLTSWSRLLATIGPQDAEQVLLPWLQAGLDHADFVHAFAPKPYLILSAIRDFFSIAGARQTFSEAETIYRLMGEPDRLDMFAADDGHGFTHPRRMAAYSWFDRWLKGEEGGAGTEPDVQLATEDELYCTESGQVLTSLGGETVFTLNRERARDLNPDLPSVHQQDAFAEEIRKRVVQLTHYSAGSQDRADLRVESFGTIDRDRYKIEKLVYESEPGIPVPALLFVSDSVESVRPGLLYVHGGGKSEEGGVAEDIENLVMAGTVVLAVDLRGMGETQYYDDDQANDFPRYFGDYDSAMTSLLIDRPLIGQRMKDISKGLDLLAERPDVDADRLMAVGVEGGSIPVLFAAVVDDRIRGIGLEGMLLSYKSVVENRIHRRVFEDVIPGLLKQFDLADLVAALRCPAVLVDLADPMGELVALQAVRHGYRKAVDSRRAAELEVKRRGVEESSAEVFDLLLD